MRPVDCLKHSKDSNKCHECKRVERILWNIKKLLEDNPELSDVLLPTSAKTASLKQQLSKADTKEGAMQNEIDRLTNELEELKSEMDLNDKEVVKLLKQVILEKPYFCGTNILLSRAIKRKAEEFDSKDAYVLYLIELIVQLQRDNEQLHRLVTVAKDVTEIKSLLSGKSESTNYTSVPTRGTTNNNNNNNNHVMVEDEEESKDEEAKKKVEEVRKRQETQKEKEGDADDEDEEEKKEREARRTKARETKKNKKKCSFCERDSHIEKSCWRRYPALAPEWWNEKKSEEVKKKYEFVRSLVQATERNRYFRPLKEAIDEEKETEERRKKNKKLKCPECKRWGHEEKSCWLLHPVKAPGWWDYEIALRQKKEREEEIGFRRNGKKQEDRKKEGGIIYNINLK